MKDLVRRYEDNIEKDLKEVECEGVGWMKVGFSWGSC
jgi:hypothetical protein